ncbi:hypothetical protein BDAP_001913 [Binucleata daphniae]
MKTATKVELEKDIKNVSHINERHQPVLDDKNIKKWYTLFQLSHMNNIKHEKLYNEIIKSFLSCYFLCIYRNYYIELKFLIPKIKDKEIVKQSCEDEKKEQLNDVECTDFVRLFCENKKCELLNKDEFKNLEIDYAFFWAFDTFVETITFTMNTMKKIIKLRLDNEDDEEFREKLIGNEKLFEDYILSLNWIKSFSDDEFTYSLIHNFHSISVDKSFDENYYILCIFYDFHNSELLDKSEQKILEKINKTLPKYYLKIKINTRQDIFDHESTKKFTEYLKSNKITHIVKGKDELKSLVRIAFNAVAMFRSKRTKINYMAKTGYYINYKKESVGLKYISYQRLLTKKLRKKICKNRKDLEFDVLSMHTTQSIVDICWLSILLENKIKILMSFTNQFLNLLIDCNKKKYKKAMLEFFDDMIDKYKNQQVQVDIKHAKQTCIASLNAIKGLTTKIQDMDLVAKLREYEETDFLMQYKNEYKVIFEQVKMVEILTMHTADHANKIYAETVKLMGFEPKRKAYFQTILTIICLFEKINLSNEKLVDDQLQTYKNLSQHSYFNNYINEIEDMISAKTHEAKENVIKRTKTPNKLKIIVHHAIANRFLKNIINANKRKIIEIVNDTVLLKSMIIDAEKYAYMFNHEFLIERNIEQNND